MSEMTWSFIIGVASGIISGIIVTVIYRIIDQERERQKYFADIRSYIKHLMNIDTSDLNAFSTYWLCNEFPTKYKWIHLKNNEVKIVQDLKLKIQGISEMMVDYFKDKSSMLEQDKNDQIIDAELINKYTPELMTIMAEIKNMVKDIFSLGL